MSALCRAKKPALCVVRVRCAWCACVVRGARALCGAAVRVCALLCDVRALELLCVCVSRTSNQMRAMLLRVGSAAAVRGGVLLCAAVGVCVMFVRCVCCVCVRLRKEQKPAQLVE